MSIKPFSEVVRDNGTKEKEPVRPFVDNAEGGKTIDETSGITDEETPVQSLTWFNKTLRFLGSAQAFLGALALFILTALFVNTVHNTQALLTSGSLLDLLYLIALVILSATLGIAAFTHYRQIMMLKNVQKIQQAFRRQKAQPDKEIVPLTLALLNSHAFASSENIRQHTALLQERIRASHDYKAIYTELDESVLCIIDANVHDRIKKASTQAALSTAISPLALLDAGIIIWRSLLLTKEIATLYGFKPGWYACVVLLKRGALNVLFAATSELALELIQESGETVLISQLSSAAAQGAANGILLARLGYGVMEACRPLPLRIKRKSFLKSILQSIKTVVTKSPSAKTAEVDEGL